MHRLLLAYSANNGPLYVALTTLFGRKVFAATGSHTTFQSNTSEVNFMRLGFSIRLPIAIAALCVLAASGDADADRQPRSVQLDFIESAQQPSEVEFVTAAKKVFFRRSMEYRVINPNVVEGTWQGRYKFEFQLVEGAVKIVWIPDSSPNSGMVRGYFRNLERDLRYELGKYLL